MAAADQLKQVIAETLSPYAETRKAGECVVFLGARRCAEMAFLPQPPAKNNAKGCCKRSDGSLPLLQ